MDTSRPIRTLYDIVGTPPPTTGTASLSITPRQRVNIIRSSHTHMTHMVDSVKGGMVSHTEMVARFGDQWGRHKVQIIERVVDEVTDTCVEQMRKDFSAQRVLLHPWQRSTMDQLNEQTRREVLFVVDACGGGCGKTWLAKYIRANHHSLYFKTTDMAAAMHLFVDHDVVVFDLSRQASVHINYDTLECLKDGVASDTHSGGKERMFVPPSVVVMMHCGPDMVALSNDRYCIHSIE